MANTRFQAKRTSTSGLLPNTTSSGNLSYIAAGEFAVNLTDKKLLTSNGTVSFEVGSNLNVISVGGNFVVNSTAINVSALGLYANGGLGSSGQALTSNGSATYWSTISSGPAGGNSNIRNVVNTSVNTSPTVIDTISTTGTTSVEYFISAIDTINTNYKTSRIAIVANSSVPYSTEYGVLLSNDSANVCTFSVDISGGNIRLIGTGDSSSVTVSCQRIFLGTGTVAGDIASSQSIPVAVAGSNTVIQFNDSGVFGGTTGFTFDKVTNNVIVANNLTAYSFTANGSVGADGNVLKSNGSATYWGTAASGTPGGSNTYVLINDSTTINGTPGFTFNKVTNNVVIANNLTVTSVTANGSVGANLQTLWSNSSGGIYWSNAAVTRQQFTGDGANTQFVVTGGYISGQLDVYVNGIKYYNGTEVTVTSGSNVVFIVAPPSGALIEVVGTAGYGIASATTPAGANIQIQFNDSGGLGATAGLTFNKTTNNFTVANSATILSITANGALGSGGQALLSNSTGGLYWGSAGATAGGANSQIQFNDGGTALNATAGFIFDKVANNVTVSNTLLSGDRIEVGSGGYDFGLVAKGEFHASINSYMQFVMQNSNTGLNASTDYIMTADSGNDSVNYIDIGINGSNYSNASFTVGGPLDGYMYSSSSNLAIGTAAAGKALVIHAGGTLATNQVLSVNSSSMTATNVTITLNSNATANTTISATNYLPVRGITILNPSSTDSATILWTQKILTVAEIKTVVRGTGTPSVTATFYTGTSRDGTSNSSIASGIVTTNVTTGIAQTTFGTSTIAANSYIWVDITAVSGTTIPEFHASIRFT